MSDFRARLMMEHDELAARIGKLTEFIVSPKFDELPEVDRADLKEQLTHMTRYFDVLNRRVSRLCGAA